MWVICFWNKKKLVLKSNPVPTKWNFSHFMEIAWSVIKHVKILNVNSLNSRKIWTFRAVFRRNSHFLLLNQKMMKGATYPGLNEFLACVWKLSSKFAFCLNNKITVHILIHLQSTCRCVFASRVLWTSWLHPSIWERFPYCLCHHPRIHQQSPQPPYLRCQNPVHQTALCGDLW